MRIDSGPAPLADATHVRAGAIATSNGAAVAAHATATIAHIGSGIPDHRSTDRADMRRASVTAGRMVEWSHRGGRRDGPSPCRRRSTSSSTIGARTSVPADRPRRTRSRARRPRPRQPFRRSGGYRPRVPDDGVALLVPGTSCSSGSSRRGLCQCCSATSPWPRKVANVSSSSPVRAASSGTLGVGDGTHAGHSEPRRYASARGRGGHPGTGPPSRAAPRLQAPKEGRDRSRNPKHPSSSCRPTTGRP